MAKDNQTKAGTKGIHEAFARFFEQPTREGLRDVLRNHFGELNQLDFKAEWTPHAKLARHILGMANSGGGCLVVGVAQQDDNSIDPVGLAALTDKAIIHKGIQKFIPTQLVYELLDFSYTESEYATIKGKRFQVMIVDDTPKYIPFVAMADGDGIRNAAIYARRGTSTEEATYTELQEMLNRRLETEYSSHRELALDEHLATLKMLYTHIRPIIQLASLGLFERQNPHYPKETYEAFVAKLIEVKKKQIEDLFQGR